MTSARLPLAIAAMLAVADGWAYRQAMNPDGISYLDIGDAYWRGDFDSAVNAYWSPLYSWLTGAVLHVTGAAPARELLWVQLMNAGIVLVSLVAFRALLGEVMRLRRGGLLGDGALQVVAYALFAWASFSAIRVHTVTPDQLVPAVVYAATALVLATVRGERSAWRFAALGLVLGLGFLAKFAVLPVAVVFLAVVALQDRRGALVAAGCAIAVAAPFVAVLSHHEGSFTAGRSGALNYAWLLGDVEEVVGWTGGEHPPAVLAEGALLYDGPGSIPAWYDPLRWYEGVPAPVRLGRQIDVAGEAAGVYARVLFSLPQLLLTLALAAAWWLAGRPVPRDRRWLGAAAPPLAALAMYALVHASHRYVGGYVAVLGLLAAAGLPASRAWVARAAVVAAGVMLAVVVGRVAIAVGEQAIGHDPPGSSQTRAAEGLRALGMRPGDRVAFVGHDRFAPLHQYWVRINRGQMAAQIWPPAELDAQLEGRLAATGVTLAVRDVPPPAGAGWARLPQTKLWAKRLRRPA